MYAINPISRNVLITPDECTAKMPNSSLDSAKWKSAIEIAEARFAVPVLGWDLYNDICTQKNVVVTSGNIAALQALFTAQFGTDAGSGNPNVVLALGNTVNAVELITTTPSYITLWNQALWNYVFNCVWFVALTENYASFTSSGIQKANPLDSSIGSTSASNVGISLNDLRYLNDRWVLDRINVLQDWLLNYICANLTLFPLYPFDECRNRYNEKTKNISRTTTFIDIYNGDDDRHRCERDWLDW